MFKTVLRSAFFTVFLSLLGLSSAYSGAEEQGMAQEIMVHHGWIRAVPPVAANSAAYMTLVNNTGVDDRLLSASTAVAKVVEVHRVIKQQDVSEMVRVDLLAVPAQSHVELKQGGYHLMLINLKRALKDGEMISMEFNFEKAGLISVELPVQRSPAAMSPEQHSHGHHH